MTDDVMSQADADIDYLYDRAYTAKIAVSEEDEIAFVEMVGKQISDGKSATDARVLAFRNWAKGKGR
jgi:hypothetical protein